MEPDAVNLPGLVQLISTAGNGAVVLLALYLLWAGKAYLKALQDIATEMKANRETFAASQESIRLAIVARDPEKARFFEAQGAG